VERVQGRRALIECMVDPRRLLARYNDAANALNARGRDHLALWSPRLLDLLSP